MKTPEPELYDFYVELTRQAYEQATRSPDPSTQNGAVLINGFDHPKFAKGFNRIHEALDQNYDDRDYKYEHITHAEVGAIMAAAAYGVPTGGATLVCPWAPCVPCARIILESRVARLVVHGPRMGLVAPDGAPLMETRRDWAPHVQEALTLLEGRCEVITINKVIPRAPAIRIGGKLWHPDTELTVNNS